MKVTELLKFKFLEELVYYDGPLLSIGVTEDNQPVFEVWLNINREEKYSLYAYVFIRPEDFYPFIQDEKMYFNVLKDSLSITAWKVNQEYYDFEEMSVEYFLENYGPNETVSLNDDLIDFREKLIELEKQYPEIKEIK